MPTAVSSLLLKLVSLSTLTGNSLKTTPTTLKTTQWTLRRVLLALNLNLFKNIENTFPNAVTNQNSTMLMECARIVITQRAEQRGLSLAAIQIELSTLKVFARTATLVSITRAKDQPKRVLQLLLMFKINDFVEIPDLNIP